MKVLSALGTLFALLLKAFQFFSAKKANEEKRKAELEEAVEEMENNSSWDERDVARIIDDINRMQK